MKIWEKGFSVNDKIEQFTVGQDRELDMYLAPFDMLASKAQAKMLASIGLISKEEENQLLTGLDELLAQVENGTFQIEADFEDVHSKIEYYLTEKFGDAGKKIHTARSRNDQVLTAIQLFITRKKSAPKFWSWRSCCCSRARNIKTICCRATPIFRRPCRAASGCGLGRMPSTCCWI
jgi:argininosuccinate lyase